MTLTLTPEPSTGPTDAPRVKAEATAPDGGTFTQLTLRRDGVETRRAPFVGATETQVYDYEAPFDVSLSYQLTGLYLPVTAPDWTETWASLASWTGSGFSASGGKAVSTTNGAQIVRSASGTIQRVTVASPDYVRVELLTAGDVVVVSVAVAANVTLTGTSATSVSGGGSFELTLSDGTATASAVDSSWSLDRPYTGTPTKVRIVSLGLAYAQSASWSNAATVPYDIAVHPSNGDLYVTCFSTKTVRRYTTAGAFVDSWSTTGTPRGIAIDSAGSVYVVDITTNVVRKFSATGTPVTSWSSTNAGAGVATDSSNNVYVVDVVSNLVRKYNSTGTPITTWSTTSAASDIAIDSSNNVYVADTTAKLIRKYNSTGTPGITWSTTGAAQAVAVDSAGDVFVADYDNKTVRRFTSGGATVVSWSLGTNLPRGIAVSSAGDVFVGTQPDNTIVRFTPHTASTDDIVTTLVTTEVAYSESATTQLDETRSWLIHPSQPSLSVAIDENQWSDTGSNVSLESAQQTTHELPTSTFSPPGRDRSVSYPLGPRRAGLWTLVLQMAALGARDALLALLADGAPLLLRSPVSYDWDLPDGWYAVGDVTQGRIVSALQQKWRTLTLPLTPAESPPVALVPEFTFGDLLLVAPTFQDVLENYDTFLDVLTGNAS